MMRDREFRELQVSSTQLAIIFIGILIIGVVIFLLGVSVGKKHAQVAEKAISVAQKAEPVKEKIVLPEIKPQEQEPVQEEPKGEIAAKQGVPRVKVDSPAEKAGKETKPGPAITPPVPPAAKNIYYVQVGALGDRQSALSTAQRFRSQGYHVVVLDPLPTDRRPVFRVRIGGFATKEEAEATKTKLASAAGRKIDYFIVRD